MKTYQTKKLYFGKWPYKVDMKAPEAKLVKRMGVDFVRRFCNSNNSYTNYWGQRIQTKPEEKQILLEFTNAVEEFLDLQVRTEGDKLSLFTDDVVLYEKIKTKMAKWITSVTEPSSKEELDQLLSKTTYILCDKLPYEQYKHKVYFRERMPDALKLKFNSWLENYSDSIRISKSTKSWLQNKKRYIQDPFIYVTDSKQLSMIGMFAGEYVKKTHEFVLRDTPQLQLGLNSVSRNESCQL